MLREMGFEPSFIGVLNQQECADIIDFIDKWWLIGAERGWLKPSVVGWALLKWWVEDGDLAKQIQGTGYNSEIKAMKNHLIWGWIYDLCKQESEGCPFVALQIVIRAWNHGKRRR
jgi:hypothetical protein